VLYLAHYRVAGHREWGVVADGMISPLSGTYSSTGELIRSGQADWLAARDATPSHAVGDVDLLSPVTTPCRVLCQGANYRQHAIESGMDPDNREFNLFFDKTDASVTGPDTPVVRPAHVRLLDFEIELAIVIKKAITRPTTITDTDLHDYVFAITIANDLSARDVQLPQGQFLKGKSYRGFCPIGPFLGVLDKDTVPLIDDLDLRLDVNGVTRQQDNTANMLYRPAETLTELSTFCDLSPGDVVLTGTPHGCVATSPPAIVRRLATALLPERKMWSAFIRRNLGKPYLAPGDTISASIRTSSGSIDLGVQHTTITTSQEV